MKNTYTRTKQPDPLLPPITFDEGQKNSQRPVARNTSTSKAAAVDNFSILLSLLINKRDTAALFYRIIYLCKNF